MFVLIAVASVACVLQARLVNGQGVSSCIYNFDCTADTNLGVINISRATTANPYQTTDPYNGVYYWKPCDDFTLAGVTAGAIYQAAGSYSTDIGKHSQAFCDVSNGNIRFNMMSGDYNMFTYVTCICGAGGTFQFDSESPYNNFNLVFTSNACCPNSENTSTSKSPSATTPSPATSSPARRPYTPTINDGTTMVIIISSLLAAVLVCGTLFVVIVSTSLKRRNNAYIAL